MKIIKRDMSRYRKAGTITICGHKIQIYELRPKYRIIKN